ncbi:MAG: MbnP family copper-binding protein [Planctomycetota bacterium]|jgi:uncharacterized repeat protein (TIGR04052 family)
MRTRARTPLTLLACVWALTSTGCDDSSDDAAGADDTAETGGDVRQIALSFAARVGDAPAACGPTYAELGADGSEATLADARFFVSGVELRDADGTWVQMALDQDSLWQYEDVALLDFEDGTGPCADSGTAEQNDRVVGTVPAGTYDAVRFDVGVPYALNHVDSAAAPPPLNAAGMFWVWRGGYKFIRVDFVPTAGVVPRWNVHIGSTGCMSAAPTTPPDTPCGRPNAARVELGGLDPDTSTVAVDLAALVAGAPLETNVEDSPPGCMSNPDEAEDCDAVFTNLGVDFASGASPMAGAPQGVFRLEE